MNTEHLTTTMSKRVEFILNRDTYRGGTTLGTLTFPDGYVCQTLEDIVRGWGIKDGGTTAIPVGEYRMTVSVSQRFKREMVMVYNQPNKFELKANGIEFKGIRIHGGNTNADTWGCIIVARRRVDNHTIQGSEESRVTAAVKDYESKGFDVILTVRNQAQKN